MELLTEPPCDPFTWGEHPVVVIERASDLRKIKIELYPEAAPVTVSYFLTLVQQGFYDGLRFHRIVADFMIQGGDPLGTGDGETEYYVKGEFAENGVDNPLLHTHGTISMARQEGCDTASCQFFITLRDTPELDGHYAAFGRVVEGLDVVDGIGRVPADAYAVPMIPIIMNRVYING